MSGQFGTSLNNPTNIEDFFPDFEKEIAIANIQDGFVYKTPYNGYLKINRNENDGSASAYLYKGTNSSGVPICGGLGKINAIVNNASQFNTGFGFLLIGVAKNENYYFVSENISRCSMSFVPCRGAL